MNLKAVRNNKIMEIHSPNKKEYFRGMRDNNYDQF